MSLQVSDIDTACRQGTVKGMQYLYIYLTSQAIKDKAVYVRYDVHPFYAYTRQKVDEIYNATQAIPTRQIISYVRQNWTPFMEKYIEYYTTYYGGADGKKNYYY